MSLPRVRCLVAVTGACLLAFAALGRARALAPEVEVEVPIKEPKKPPLHPATEKAVADGLRWLALHQAADGHWGLHDFNKHARTIPLPRGVVGGDKSTPGTTRKNDVAGTALGLLPFLAAGHTHKAGAKGGGPDYSKVVDASLRSLISKQSKAGGDKGYFGGDAYAHALATIALCEAYKLTSDPALKASAQFAVDYAVAAQDPVGGGWRYKPKEAGDTSVTGWYLQALVRARMAGLTVPRIAMRRAEKYLDAAETSKNSGGYAYVPGGGETPTMTAVGLFCRQYLGANPRNPGLRKGVKKLKAHPPGTTGNIYYDYYATQVIHHMGGDHWKFWNLGPAGTGRGGIRDQLIKTQDKGDKNTDNKGTWAGTEHVGGRLGATSLSLLTLQVPQHHSPMYQPELVLPDPE